MTAPYHCFDSTLLLTSERHKASTDKVLALQKLSKSYSPFYKPSQIISIDDARRRRSQHSDKSVELAAIAELLHLVFYCSTPGMRPYPAAGGIYTVQLYLIANSVINLDNGVYFLRYSDEALEQIGTSDDASTFQSQNLFQNSMRLVPLTLLLIADTQIAQNKYHDRSSRMALIEAGCLLQTIYLASTRLGLPACALGAISDRSAFSVAKLRMSKDVIFACAMAVGGSEV